MASKPLCPRTLRYVARELISIAEAFYEAPKHPLHAEKDRARGDILSARGHICLTLARSEERKQRKARALERKTKAGKKSK